MLSNIGPSGLIIILLIAILLFGGKKIPEIAKGLGKGIRDFKSAMKGDDESDPKPVSKADEIENRENRPSV